MWSNTNHNPPTGRKAVCKSNAVLQCVAACGSVLAVCCGVLRCAAVCCSVLQCVAVCCSVLQCVAVRCSVLQRVYQTPQHQLSFAKEPCTKGALAFCAKTHARTVGRCRHTLDISTHCNTLQHTLDKKYGADTHTPAVGSCHHTHDISTCCIGRRSITQAKVDACWSLFATHCNVLHRTATHCNTLPHASYLQIGDAFSKLFATQRNG